MPAESRRDACARLLREGDVCHSPVRRWLAGGSPSVSVVVFGTTAMLGATSNAAT